LFGLGFIYFVVGKMKFETPCGEWLPSETIEQLRKAYHQQSQGGFAILDRVRTEMMLARFQELRKTLKFKGCIQIPLFGKIGK
jgi:hypothetical protein